MSLEPTRVSITVQTPNSVVTYNFLVSNPREFSEVACDTIANMLPQCNNGPIKNRHGDDIGIIESITYGPGSAKLLTQYTEIVNKFGVDSEEALDYIDSWKDNEKFMKLYPVVNKLRKAYDHKQKGD